MSSDGYNLKIKIKNKKSVICYSGLLYFGDIFLFDGNFFFFNFYKYFEEKNPILSHKKNRIQD